MRNNLVIVKTIQFALVGAAAAALACAPKLDTTRQIVDDGTFGKTVYTLACKRVAYQRDLTDGDATDDVSGKTYSDFCRNGGTAPSPAYAAVLAMNDVRDPLIQSIDTVFPDGDLTKLQSYLTSNEFLAVYDDGTAEKAVDKLSTLLGMMADDPDFAPALSRLDGRWGYRPLEPATGMLRAVTAYPDLDHTLLVFTDAITPGGSANEEFGHFQLALSKEFSNATPAADPKASDRSLKLALDLLLTESPLLGDGVPRLVVRRDVRGLAKVAIDPATSKLAAPFVDLDGDGLADANADGRFIDATGAVIEPPSPFATPYIADSASARDADGRALIATAGPPVFEYVDLDKTVIAAVARDGRDLFDPAKGTALDMLRGASALLGPRMTVTHSYADGTSIDYRGYDTTASALLDMLHGVLVLTTDPGIQDTLAFAKALLTDHEPEAARLMEAIWDVTDLGKQFPGAKLEPGSPLYDDLIPVVNEILATPGLGEDLLRALENPQTQQLALRFSDFMKFSDQLDYDPNTQQITGTLGATPVDRTMPDSGFNRSLMQRLLHLIADSSGVQLCNKEGSQIKLLGITLETDSKCNLLKIDDLAVFYVQSIAYGRDGSGNFIIGSDGKPQPKAHLVLNFSNPLVKAVVNDSLMESQSTIKGFTSHPTPQALNRVLLLNPAPAFISNVQDPAVCKDGDRFIDAHTGTLPVWELNGFYEQMQPIVQAFADHNQEKLFVKTLVVLHSHYPSRQSTTHQNVDPNMHGFAKESDIHSYEPFIVEIIEKHDLWNALTQGAPVIDAITANGKQAPSILVGTGKFLFAPQAGLTKRLGATSTMTDDGQPVATLSPWYLLADAYKEKRAQVLAAATEGDAWERSVGQYVDLFARGEDTGGGVFRFKNPRFRGVSIALIDFLSGRIAAHTTTGDLAIWAKQDMPSRAEQILGGPLFAGAADFVLSLSAAPEARASLEGLNQYLVDEVANDAAFQTALIGAADLAQMVLDDEDLVPVVKMVGRALDPGFGLVDAHLAFMKEARHADTSATLTRLVRNLFVEYVPGRTAVGEIVDSIAEIHRANPDADLGKLMSPDDFRSVFRNVADFLGDEKRGLRKFVKIVENRHVTQ